MAEKVEAWKTMDGRLFHNEEDATKHEQSNQKYFDMEKTFEDKLPNIIQYIVDYYKEQGWQVPEEINPTYEEHGWDCEDPTNPIGVCIYDWDNSNESCVYCGQPEERK